jgi:hypothetical protein
MTNYQHSSAALLRNRNLFQVRHSQLFLRICIYLFNYRALMWSFFIDLAQYVPREMLTVRAGFAGL